MTSHEDLRRIERLAFRLWEQEGCPPGRALPNWLKAEKLLSDDSFLEQELQTETYEGGIVPSTQLLPPTPLEIGI